MTHMSALVLKLEGHEQHVRKTTTSDDQEVFSVMNFMKLVCKSDHATTWKDLKNLPEMEVLVVVVPLRVKSPPTPYKPPVMTRLGPATTRTGLQKLLLLLGEKMKDEFRQLDDSAFNLFMSGDNSRITEFDFSSTKPLKERKKKQIHYNHYNFMPPTASAQEPVASMLIENEFFS
jgi:hypothetical protein